MFESLTTPVAGVGYALTVLAALAWIYVRGVPRFFNFSFCFVSLAVLVFVRWPIIQYNAPLNPDEGQMIANAMNYARDFMPFRSVDSTTSGPLNSMVLMWPYAFGGAVTFASIRITALALLAGAWLFVFAALSRTSQLGRFGASGGLMLFLISAGNPDYNAYSSEQLSIFLICFSFFVVLRLDANGRTSDALLFAAGAALGAVPYCKMQGTPVAMVAGIYLLLLILLRSEGRRIIRVATLVIGCMLASILLLVPLALVGELHQFWDWFLDWTVVFGSERMARIPLTINFLTADPYFSPYFYGFIALSFVGLATLCGRLGPRKIAVLAGASWLAAACFAIVASRMVFTHYLLWLVPPLAITAGLLLADRSKKARLINGVSVAALYCAILAGTLSGARSDQSPFKAIDGLFSAGELYAWLPQKKDGLLVWGWAPEIHAYSNVAPAGMDTHSWGQIEPSSAQQRLRDRTMSELSHLRPAVVVDSVAPGSFYYSDAKRFGVSSFPELAKFLDRDYVRLSAGNACPSTYARRDLFQQMKFAKIKEISASAFAEFGEQRFLPSLVDDFNIYESCIDRWILPNGTLGDITLRLERPGKVSAVWILNTRNGIYPMVSTATAKVSLLSNGTAVDQQTVEVRRYPAWTIVRFPAVEVDAVKIDILSFHGYSAGLNEVKIETD